MGAVAGLRSIARTCDHIRTPIPVPAPTNHRSKLSSSPRAQLACAVRDRGGLASPTSTRTVNIEVDGVIRPVSTWRTRFPRLERGRSCVAEHDLVQPSIHQQVSDGQTIVVRTREALHAIDGSRKTLWSTAFLQKEYWQAGWIPESSSCS